jgi:hypothetical protein
MAELRDTLLEVIHTRAKATYTGPDPLANNAQDYDQWIAHWKATALVLAAEFREQGLERTALAAEEWGK